MKFTESHEWIRIEGDIGTVGITSHAQKELGEIVFVELPSVGKSVKYAEEAVVLESTKAAADVYSPASGEIIAVNTQLKSGCNSLNSSPENEGWLFKLKLKDPSELDQLMNSTEYKNSIS